MSWLSDRLAEKSSQNALSALVAAVATGLASSGLLPVWSIPIVYAAMREVQTILTPDSVTIQPVITSITAQSGPIQQETPNA